MSVQGNPALRSLALCFALLFFSAVEAQGVDDQAGPLVVEETSGAAKIKLADRWQTPAAGMVVTLPATVSTGSDGSVELRQDETIISIAANTAIELIAGPEPGAPLQRAVQDKGSAFYDIAPRARSRLRVETPWLVAVIKGTEFNVTVAAETSTVALFEGRLQIEAPGSGDVVDLRQGQIAKRHKDDPGITILAMDGAEAVPERGAAPEAQNPGDAAAGSSLVRRDDNGSGGEELGAGASFNDGMSDGFEPELLAVGDEMAVELEAVASLGDTLLHVPLEATLELAVADVGLDAVADLDGGEVDLGLAGDAGIGDTTADIAVDLGVDLDGGAIDLGLDSGIDAGDTTVDLGTDVAVDLDQGNLDLGLAAGIDIGGDVPVDAGIDAGIGAGDSGLSLDAGLDAGVDLADTSLQAGLDTGIDIGGDLATEVDSVADVTVAGVDVGLDVGVDLGLGNLDDLEVDLGLELDLLGEDEEESEEDEEVNLPLDPGDLLDLLRF